MIARPVRVFLVDDQDLFRAGLTMILESSRDIEVVGESSDGKDALRAIPAAHPDVVLMDIRMPGLDGIEATRQLLAGYHRGDVPRILILTTLETVDASSDALRAGASGFMLKNTEPDFLLAAVKALAQGQQIIASKELPDFGKEPPPPPEYGELTEREKEVFQALSRGLNNREIAETLYLSEATIKTHITAILQKLCLRDRVQVVVYAYKYGLAGEPN